MTTLNTNHNIEFSGRKPSKAQIMRAIGLKLEEGNAKSISVLWGENWIDLVFYETYKSWQGNGWIRDISGDDISKELNLIRKLAQNQLAAEMMKAGKLQVIYGV